MDKYPLQKQRDVGDVSFQIGKTYILVCWLGLHKKHASLCFHRAFSLSYVNYLLVKCINVPDVSDLYTAPLF